MRDQVTLQCRCGALRGKLTGLSELKSKRIVCLCDDCQAFPHYLGRAQDVLDANGGTDIFPVYPSQITFTQGTEHIKCLRLTRQGLLRWYADCCNTPIANVPPNPKLPYAGVIHSIMNHAADGTTADAALGPIYARIMGKSGLRPLPPGTHQKASLSVILMAVRLIASGWIKGRQQPSPFFDESSGRPRVEPYVLTPEERDRLRKLCGPR
jgi:hypothetical protein